MPEFSHLDARGEVRMVDVSAKPAVRREAVAEGLIVLSAETLRRIHDDRVAKGNVLATARIAAIQAAKRTGDLIPLCHPLPLSQCEVEFTAPPEGTGIRIVVRVITVAPTGVEMEALTAVSIAALTIYDMCKAVDPGMRIEGIHLLHKRKGPSPHPGETKAPGG